ncbi:MAG: SMC-Scp complex subunit ScpB [Opitutaceae bacterium]|nr:SMC-Scp complex subunit ScpB [Opitutaceae bacterium]
MAFNLQKVLKALLFSSSQPLSVKDIQNLFGKFHEDAVQLEIAEREEAQETAPVASADAAADVQEPGTAAESSVPSGIPVAVEADAPAEVEAAAALPPEDAELYSEVPSLVTATQIREAMDAIAAELKAANDIFFLVEGPTGFRLVTHPRFARWIRILRNEPPPVKLTQSALETLAIIAYRQPVTRTEIESIRGVSAEAGLNKLLERELVYITGRADLPGRPLQYGTTDKFLDFVGVKSLVELPASDVLSPRQIDQWLRDAIDAKPPTDAEMGLPLEEGEGPSPSLEEVSLDAAKSQEQGPEGGDQKEGVGGQ